MELHGTCWKTAYQNNVFMTNRTAGGVYAWWTSGCECCDGKPLIINSLPKLTIFPAARDGERKGTDGAKAIGGSLAGDRSRRPFR